MSIQIQIVKWAQKWSHLNSVLRNSLILDSVSWLEREARPKCSPEELTHLINFENSLQNLLNQQKISESWFISTGQTYRTFPFFQAFLRRSVY